ncbi:MAG: geranylgeranyl reductase family protein [Deltaproteobacteria bacterium]|nr:geranylgeranyl reductase family protein [Deltaproteobacteria bacterium]MBZ0220609.1 geranylgeranyl reductase family protein [Deltaproteobacteria bacterium]
MYDAIVAGLGPAGSTAAYFLSRAGLKVLGVDKETFPRYKSCGGCISTKIDGLYDFDISQAIEETVYGASFTYKSGRPLDIISDKPVGYNVMRDTFDHLLLDKAREAGADIIEGARIRSAEDTGTSVKIGFHNGTCHEARVLVGADGASGFIGRELFGLGPRDAAVSITAEVPYNRELRGYSGRLFIDFGCVPHGYAWIFPKKNFLSVGIAASAQKAVRIKEYFNSFVSSHGELKGLDIGPTSGWTVPVYYDGAPPPIKGRVVLVGDTGHLVEPFLGEGIYYAAFTAKAASSVILDYIGGRAGLEAYPERLETEIMPGFRSALKLADLVYNHPRLWYGIIERDPQIMLRYYDVIRGAEECSSFYSWALNKVKSKPWKVLRSWIETRFIQP